MSGEHPTDTPTILVNRFHKPLSYYLITPFQISNINDIHPGWKALFDFQLECFVTGQLVV
jgi:hypothetical protein